MRPRRAAAVRDGRSITVGVEDDQIRVCRDGPRCDTIPMPDPGWETLSCSEQGGCNRLSQPPSHPRAVLSPNGGRVALLGDDLRIWDRASRSEIFRYPESPKGGVVFSPDGTRMVWHVPSVFLLVFAPDGTWLAASIGGPVGIYDTATARQLQSPRASGVALAVSADSSRLVTSLGTGAYVWRVARWALDP